MLVNFFKNFIFHKIIFFISFFMKSIISLALVFVISFFLNVNYCIADEIEDEINNNFFNELNSNDIENDISKKGNIPKTSNEDIFGDEQAFPFIAGLGKNAAH